MASRKVQEIAGSDESGAGPNRGFSGGMTASADSQRRDLGANLNSLTAEATHLTNNVEKISEKLEATSFVGQSGDSFSNCSQTSILEAKLGSLVSEITNLTSDVENVSVSVETYKESVNKISKSLPTIRNRFRLLESSVVRLLDDRSVQCLENRFSSLDKSLDKLINSKLPDIETKVNFSLNELRNQLLPCLESRINLLESFQSTNLCAIESRLDALESSKQDLHLSALESIESRLSKLESSQNQTTADLGKRLKGLETSVNKLQDQPDLPVIEARLNSLKSSLEERQDKEKAEAKKDVHELATVVDVLCNDNLSDVEAKTAKNIAERFGMMNSLNKLSSFIGNILSLITCIQIFKEEFGQTLITNRNAAFRMILQNFNTISESAVDFCELSLEEMRCILYSSELRATAEQMFNAISKWVEKDRLSRTPMASLLLPAVQFSRCSLTFLRIIRDDILVKAHSTVQQSVEEALKKYRSDVLFVLGGYDSNGIIEALNKSKLSWLEQKNISNGPSDKSFAFTTGHQILILEVTNKRFRSFDTLTKEWNTLRPLPAFRDRLSAAMEGNELFVMGGEDEHESRCDVYDHNLDSWTEASILNVGRWYSASSSLKGKIYCCGGRDSDYESLSSMEMFDPKEKSKGWTMTTSMSVGKVGLCLVSCGQYLWAFGGGDRTNYPTDLERFEPKTNSWTTMASMPTGRAALTACFYGGRIYAIGGFIEGSLNTIEVYNAGEDRWTTGQSLNRGRYWHTSCVVKEMANADEYQWFASFLII